MKLTHACLDCGFESDYDGLCLHVRTVHAREPLSGPTLAVGDTILHEGVKCRVLELMENGNAMVQPLGHPRLSLTCEYRVAQQPPWQFAWTGQHSR